MPGAAGSAVAPSEVAAILSELDQSWARPTPPPCGSGSLTDVPPDARPAKEFFAQVVVMYSATDDEAAVQLANSSSYGLSGAVYCSFEHGS